MTAEFIRLEDVPLDPPASCVVAAEFRCSTCGACMGHDGCEDSDNPLQPEDCSDCKACADCVKRCSAQRDEGRI